MCKLFISLVLVVAYMLPGMQGQEYIAQVKYFGLEDGLSHRDVQCIHQDRQGFIWIGTNYGLNRFDGYDFQWFTKEKNGLQSNIISHILEDEDGWMWLIHTKSRAFPSPLSIDLFNPLTEEVLSLEERFGKALPFELRDVSSFAASPDGRIAFVTTGKKLILYSHEKGFETADLDIYPFSLALFSERNTIFGYASKNDPSLKDVLAEIDLNGKIRNRYEHDFPFQYNYIGGMDQNGDLWYLLKHWDRRWETDQKGKIFKIDAQGNEREFQLTQTLLPPGSVNLDIPAYSNEYGFWISPNDGFYWLFGRHSFQVFHPASGWYSELISSYEGLAHPNVVFFDNMDKAWVGTEFGLYVIELNKNPFLTIAHQSADEKQSAFRGITEDPGHTLWACIDRGLGWIGRFRPKGRHFEREITERENSEWGRGYKYGIFTDSKGFVWFGSGEDEVITRYNPADDTYRVIPNALARKTDENKVNIWSFFEDRQGRIWFGTDAGVIGYVDEKLMVSTLDELEGVNPKGGCIYQFLEDKNGRVWVATDNGLFTLHPKQNKVSAYRRGGLLFLREGVFHIHEDDDGSLWLGTSGLGLIHWYPDTGKYQQYTKADGLSNNTIYAVYEDEHDNLWMSSDYGIIRFGKNTHRVTAYLEKDGIAHREFNRISHFKGEDGMIYFGGLNGITAFYPKDLEGEAKNVGIPLVLTGFQQFDDRQNELIDKTIALRVSNTITLAPNDHFFRVEFALLNFIETENIQYAYKIDGVDTDWTYQMENSIRFSRLPFGGHILRIKGQAPNGQWSENELAIKVLVLKPFYLQTWFLIFFFLAIPVFALSFYRWRVWTLQKNHQHLEAEVLRQTGTIRKQAEELRELDKIKSRFFANVSHELRTPLTLILGPVNTLMKSQEWSPKSIGLLRTVHSNAQDLLKLVSSILDLSKMEAGKLEMNEQPQALFHFLRRLVSNFESHAQQKGIDFLFEYRAEKNLQLLLDKEKLETILNNFLSNAFKFTPGKGAIHVQADDLGHSIRISVSDTGRGIHPGDLPFIFDRFFQSRATDMPTEGGTGIGLALSQELARLMGGSIQVESELGKGSSFRFEFPRKEVMGSMIVPETEITQSLPSEMLNGSYEQHSLENGCILIVEDNNTLGAYLQSILSADYNVTLTQNGAEALEVLPELSACGIWKKNGGVVLSDIMMPVMDGFQLLERLKSDPCFAHIPVIMLTARADMQDKLHALRTGVDDYLLKPFAEDELKVRISNLLGHYRQRWALSGEMEGAGPGEDEPGLPSIAPDDLLWLERLESEVRESVQDDRLTVQLIASKVFLSERQLHRRLKAITGLSPNEYLREIRLQEARRLLEGRLVRSVKEAAFRVCFRDEKYFAQIFKARFGKNPSEI